MPRIPMIPLLERLAQIALVAAVCLAFAVAIMPTGEGPSRYNDKLVHGVTFFVLGGLAAAGFRRYSALALFAALTGFGGLIEIVQWATDWGRSAELADLAADMVGGAIGIAIARFIPREP